MGSLFLPDAVSPSPGDPPTTYLCYTVLRTGRAYLHPRPALGVSQRLPGGVTMESQKVAAPRSVEGYEGLLCKEIAGALRCSGHKKPTLSRVGIVWAHILQDTVSITRLTSSSYHGSGGGVKA